MTVSHSRQPKYGHCKRKLSVKRGTIVFKSLLRTYSALSRRASYLRERQATD
jgi:hypothetical protein